MDISPLWISLKIAFFATIITFIIGIIVARLVSGMKIGKSLIDSILSIPLVLPPTVVGFLLLILLGRNSSIGRTFSKIGIDFVFTIHGAVIAACIVSFPIMYRTVRGAIDQVDKNIIDVARTLGIGEIKIFFNIIIPNAWPGIAAATVLSFARALGEFGATIMVAGNIPGKTQTMSVAVYTYMQSGNRQKAYVWVGIIIAFSLVTLILMNYWTEYSRRKNEFKS